MANARPEASNEVKCIADAVELKTEMKEEKATRVMRNKKE
jgi:hypothetical protein